ncbi:MAG TPA: hypothetical protein PLS49_00225 [Candidatus Woesebacteria bacterium]|nr:hypothetical protein [Candidatus Woesebacteria bacterium]
MKNSFFTSNGFIYSTSIILLTLILFVFLHPFFRLYVFSEASKSSLDQFIENTNLDQSINPKQFWGTREFYAPGSFILKKEGFNESEFKTILQNMHTDIYMTEAHPFLTFNSNKWESVEILTPAKIITDVVKNPIENAKTIVLKTDTDLVYYTKNNTLQIFFIRPISIMEQTNGFLDYKEYDLEILKDKNWLVISEIQL